MDDNDILDYSVVPAIYDLFIGLIYSLGHLYIAVSQSYM